MDLGLSGKKALVLGASRGLGAAAAQALAAEGVTVFAAARNVGALTPSEAIRPIQVDLADKQSIGALIETVQAEGGVDILVNNGGGPKAGPAQGQPTSAWTSAFEVMALPFFGITDALIGGMIEKGWGRILTIGSSGIVQPIPNLGLSNGIRGAIAGWSKTLANEVAPHGITVNMIIPGRVATDRLQELDSGKAERTGASLEDVQAASRAEIPVGRYGRPDEFGAVAAFLASQQASYITGSIIRVDGGLIRGL
ncbi:SDR family oxidoreductase [Rhizobium sp. CC-YZS058]|uniref:SDR family oxidoreductase n=1 Tax=Rhizobium sp. CC-YZS058 TaxID=3042153 RepID=UPI002B057201|nr:SDR family oxidoreductase [Rhizobium sp. CC-YZS058]MEA3535897.1 SDR family oxidoreductase [Rhizobium sp. CC-YZS058]